jgi:hypothetical protein
MESFPPFVTTKSLKLSLIVKFVAVSEAPLEMVSVLVFELKVRLEAVSEAPPEMVTVLNEAEALEPIVREPREALLPVPSTIRAQAPLLTPTVRALETERVPPLCTVKEP